MMLLSNATINAIRYKIMVIQRTWVMAAGSNLAFKIAAKLLPTETWIYNRDVILTH